MWYEPIINNRCPDFVVLGPDIGLIVLEIKDWSIDYIKSADRNNFTLISNEVKKNPLKQAREYIFSIVDRLKQNEYLVENNGLYKGNLIFTYGYGVIFTEILEESFLNSDLKNIIDPDLVIFKDDLNHMFSDLDKERLKAKLQLMFPTTFVFPVLDEKVIDIIKSEISGTYNGKVETMLLREEEATYKINEETHKKKPKNKSKALLVGIAAIILIGTLTFYFNSFDGSSKISSDDVKTGVISMNESNISNTNAKDKNDSTIPVDIETINTDMKDKIVVIEGNITNINKHKNGHLFLTVSDSTGEILVPIFADKQINHSLLITDKKYRFKGKVEEYEGNLEVIPEIQDDVVLLDIYTIKEITSDMIGDTVVIEGKITNIYKHDKGHLFLTVSDSTGEIKSYYLQIKK